MMQSPSRPRSWFLAVMLLLLIAIHVYSIVRQGGLSSNFAGIVLDFLLLLVCFRICVFFYAQFVLPVRTLQDRQTMGSRMLMHARHAHGPAIFVRNGRLVERNDEHHESGPGLLWVDTASAVVTRSGTGLKQALGPGIHFLEGAESISSVFSLHTQTCSVGPDLDDGVFEKLPDGVNDQQRRKHVVTQAKRMSVSARTRDGNEVVPRLTVVFKLDANPAAAGRPGSRFGFAKEIVEKAARGEGVNPDPELEERSTVAWNQLPGLIAADLWREYLGRFTLDELFSSSFAPLPDILQPEGPAPASTVPQQPLIVRRSFPARLVGRLNDSIERWLESHGIWDEARPDAGFGQKPGAGKKRGAAETYTALQIIAHMMRARMTQAVVPILDECGRVVSGHIASDEYKRLTERGLLIRDVAIDGIRFEPAVEAEIIQEWNTGWLSNAVNQRRQIEQLELLAVQAGRQQALLEHAQALANEVTTGEPESTAAAVSTLLQATQHQILADERLFQKAAGEIASLAQLLKWAESGTDE